MKMKNCDPKPRDRNEYIIESKIYWVAPNSTDKICNSTRVDPKKKKRLQV